VDITVKGRHTGVPERFREALIQKLAKLQKFDHKTLRVDVEVSQERNPRVGDRRERVEITCHSRGPVIRAEACADDRYAALDIALSRLKERLRKAADRRKVHYGSHSPMSLAAATAALASETDVSVRKGSQESQAEQSEQADLTDQPVSTPPNDQDVSPDQLGGGRTLGAVPQPRTVGEGSIALHTKGGEPLIVREKVHMAKPMSLDQALFEMELVGHDFFLFRNRDEGVPSVVYRRKGYDYGVIRLQE
jgi:ribosomal subunit interface protein